LLDSTFLYILFILTLL